MGFHGTLQKAGSYCKQGNVSNIPLLLSGLQQAEKMAIIHAAFDDAKAFKTLAFSIYAAAEINALNGKEKAVGYATFDSVNQADLMATALGYIKELDTLNAAEFAERVQQIFEIIELLNDAPKYEKLLDGLNKISNADLFAEEHHEKVNPFIQKIFGNLHEDFPKGSKSYHAAKFAFNRDVKFDSKEEAEKLVKEYAESDAVQAIMPKMNLPSYQQELQLSEEKEKLEKELLSDLSFLSGISNNGNNPNVSADLIQREQDAFNAALSIGTNAMWERYRNIHKEVAIAWHENNPETLHKVQRLKEIDKSLGKNVGAELIENIKKHSKLHDDDISNIVDGVKFTDSANQSIKSFQYFNGIEFKKGKAAIDSIKDDVLEFFKLTNGKLKIPKGIHFTKSSNRQYATNVISTVGSAPVINIGTNFSKRALFHELGHLLEFDPAAKSAANAMLLKQSGGEVKPLKELTGIKSYRSQEVAYTGSFPLSPYMGKVYDSQSTEVFSMALEYLSSPESATEMLSLDEELAKFVVGYLAAEEETAEVSELYIKTDDELSKRYQEHLKSLKETEYPEAVKIQTDFALSKLGFTQSAIQNAFEYICRTVSGFRKGQKFEVVGFNDWKTDEYLGFAIAKFDKLKTMNDVGEMESFPNVYVMVLAQMKDGKIYPIPKYMWKFRELYGKKSVQEKIAKFSKGAA